MAGVVTIGRGNSTGRTMGGCAGMHIEKTTRLPVLLRLDPPAGARRSAARAPGTRRGVRKALLKFCGVHLAGSRAFTRCLFEMDSRWLRDGFEMASRTIRADGLRRRWKGASAWTLKGASGLHLFRPSRVNNELSIAATASPVGTKRSAVNGPRRVGGMATMDSNPAKFFIMHRPEKPGPSGSPRWSGMSLRWPAFAGVGPA
jgi:hypothetical protein